MQKKFWIRASIKKFLTKYQIFTILPQISHFHKFCNFSSIFATFETNCFIPINFMAGTCQEYSFIFASCHPLKQLSIWIPQSSSIHPSIFPFILTFAASPSPNLTILSYKLYRSLCVKVNRMLQLFYARHISVCLCTVCNFIQCSFAQLWCSLISSLCIGQHLPMIVFHNKFAHCEYLSA